MANTIKLKRGSGSDPGASDLVIGEIAIRSDNGKLFTKKDNGTIAEISGSGGGGSDIFINTLSSSSGSGGGSASFNGSATRFTLSNPPDISAQQLIVSINGVIQKPNSGTSPSEGFAIDGTDIIFSAAPATGADFFIITYGSIGVSVPADNSVTSAKIVDGAIVNADINASAAIAGSKISPNFGSQAVSTTGDLTIDTNTLKVDSSNNRVGIGVSSPDVELDINGDASSNTQIRLRKATTGNYIAIKLDRDASGTAGGQLGISGTSGHFVTTSSQHDIILRSEANLLFGIGQSEKMRIDTSGRVLIGHTTSTPMDNDANNPIFAVEGAGNGARIAVRSTDATASNGAFLYLTRTRGTSAGSKTTVQSGDALGGFIFMGADGTHDTRAARILAECDGTPGDNDMPGRLVFETTPDGGLNTVERMRISANGNIAVNFDGAGNQTGTFRIADGSASAPGLSFWADGAADTGIFRSGANTLNFSTNGSERMRIDTNGRVIIGATSHIGGAQFVVMGGNINTYGVIAIGNKVANPTSGTFASFRFNSGATGTRRGAEINATIDGNWTDGTSHPSRLSFSTTPSGATGSDERLRIQADGDIRFQNYGTLFGNSGLTISNTGSGGPQLLISRSSNNPLLLNRNTSDGEIVDLRRGWGAGGSIHVGTNSATYNTSSDYRLKENIVAISDGITRLKTLKPSRFNWIGDEGNTRDGFIAHEVTAVPEAITGTKDEVYTEDRPDVNIKAGDPKYQGIDQSKLVPLLVAALQEEITKREALESRVAALEAA